MMKSSRSTMILAVMTALVAAVLCPSSNNLLVAAQQENDACDESTPCQNGGTCHFDEDRQVNYCHCPQGTGGKLCHGTNCPLTCRNGGSCRHAADDNLDFFCECVGGYTGDSCELAPGVGDGSTATDSAGDLVDQEATTLATGSSNNNNTKSSGGMSFGGKFFVALLVIAIVGAFAFVFIRRRHPSSRGTQSNVDKNAAVHEAETYEDAFTTTSSSDDVEDAVKSIEAQQRASSFRDNVQQSTSQSTHENIEDLEDFN